MGQFKWLKHSCFYRHCFIPSDYLLYDKMKRKTAFINEMTSFQVLILSLASCVIWDKSFNLLVVDFVIVQKIFAAPPREEIILTCPFDIKLS